MPDLDILKSLGIGTTSVTVIAYVIWQLFIKVKTQMKDDDKSVSIDARIDKYTETLQQSADKLASKLEELQKSRDDLVLQNASLGAELLIAKRDLESLKASIQDSMARVKYLESVLKEKGINYV